MYYALILERTETEKRRLLHEIDRIYNSSWFGRAVVEQSRNQAATALANYYCTLLANNIHNITDVDLSDCWDSNAREIYDCYTSWEDGTLEYYMLPIEARLFD